MKSKILLIGIFIAFAANIFAQSSNQNHIITRTYTNETATEHLDQIQYFDGLGRPNEMVLKQITPDQQDLVSILEYDNFGRELKQWLPAKINQDNGNFVDFDNFKSTAGLFYSGDNRPFVENILETSPLNRFLGQKGAGADWENHPTQVQYLANTASEVPYFEVFNNQLRRNGFYAANALYKTVVIDEDDKTTTEYKDKFGRVIMTAQADDYKTCYIYDDFGNLRYVLPPLATDELNSNVPIDDGNSKLEDYAYIYKYDERGNQISKKLPGCLPIFMVYDKANRLVLSQDGNQRKNDPINQYWTATTYDIFGRILYSCEIINNQDHSNLLTYYKTRLVVDKFNALSPIGYTANHFMNCNKILIVNYYDNYNFLNLLNSNVSTALTYEENSDYDEQYANAKTLLTGTRSYILDGTDEFLTTAFYYDAKGRIVQTRATNHLDGFDIVYNKYNFLGAITNTLKEHSVTNSAATEHYTNEYDHAQRLKKTEYSLNGNTPIIIAENIYDDLGRLIEKNRHNNTDIEEFEYNIKNWLTKIQSGSFVQNISYEGLYNGNIKSISTPNLTFNYTYDEFNRLTEGISDNGLRGSNFDEFFSYDKHGNILILERISAGRTIDNLKLTYDGNQLINVEDRAPHQTLYNTKQYNPKGDGTFEYDNNGNLIKDSDRKILSIEYNILNLPCKIVFENGVIINSYATDGRKLLSLYVTKVMNNYNPLHLSMYDILHNGAGVEESNSTVYIRNFEYLFGVENATLRIHNPEGYFANGDFFYYRKDHLGNNREVWNAITQQTVQRTDYYPSGLPIYSNNTLGIDEQPYKFGGKEFIEMEGYDSYDFHARGMYPAIMRFMQIDPMAEKYYSISPYAYCDNNPIRFTDPTGMELDSTTNTHVYVDELIAETHRKMQELDDKKARKGRLSVFDQENYAELEATLFEIGILISSDQMYGVKIDDSQSKYPDNPYDRHTSQTELRGFVNMGDNGVVYINLPSKMGNKKNAFVAHELKHCFQFEMGQLGLRLSGTKEKGWPWGYDQNDEFEAHRRGAVFGGVPMSRKELSVHPVYGKLPSNNSRAYPFWNADVLQNNANRTNSYIRYNRVTYSPQ